jgi:solute carrier family 25 (mitochondrial phosphate transporter), member 3
VQTNPAVYKGLGQGLSLVFSKGLGEATVGYLPTLIGYSAQGFFKFGLYEIFKDVYAGFVDPETAFKYRSLLWLAASASAEVFADAALAPWEAVKVRMQTSLPEANFPRELGPALSRIHGEEGFWGFYKGIGPLWGRQIPYTMVKFGAFENIVELFYTNIFTAPKDTYSKPIQLGITFTSGYIAGVFCAVISQPADTIVSKLNQNKTATIGSIVAEQGLYNLATKGLGPRILMVGTLTGLQWWIYDTFKVAVGLKASGGAVKK